MFLLKMECGRRSAEMALFFGKGAAFTGFGDNGVVDVRVVQEFDVVFQGGIYAEAQGDATAEVRGENQRPRKTQPIIVLFLMVLR